MQRRQGGCVANLPPLDQILALLLLAASLNEQLERQFPQDVVGGEDEILVPDVLRQGFQQ